MDRQDKLIEAMNELRRFMHAANEALNEIKEFQKQISPSGPGYKRTGEPNPSRKFAASKRASLDLAATLVRLRSSK